MKMFVKFFLLVLVAMGMSFVIYFSTVSNVKEENLEKELALKIKSNEKLYSSLSVLLYEFNKDVIVAFLDSLYNDRDIVKIEFNDFSDNIDLTLDQKESSDQDLLVSSFELLYNSDLIGSVTIYYTRENIDKQHLEYRKNIFTFSILVFIFMVIALYFIMRRLTRSIDQLSEATDTITSGDLSKKIIIKSKDEIGDLSKKFEKMRLSLIQREEENTKQTREISALNEEMISTQKKLIEILGEVIEKRYIDDPNHIKRVAKTSYVLAKKMGLSEEEAQTLKTVSPMHDLGKVGISDAILLKPSELTLEEFKEMKKHPKIGYDFLKNTGKKTLDLAADVAYEHHEKWDGTGYPRGLKGEEIKIQGRITTLADVFDALANKRCYKEAWEIEDVKKYIIKNSGSQFDPSLVEVFLRDIDEFLEIQEQYKD